jgi:ribosome biogenesis GTPase
MVCIRRNSRQKGCFAAEFLRPFSVSTAVKHLKMEEITLNIKDYGYIGEQEGTVARITSVHRERFGIAGDFGEGYARLKAGEYYAGDEIFPTAGDFVRIDYIDNGDSRIISTLPRKTVFTRRDPGPIPKEQAVAANFD